ncbi:MAG: hypothetical protein ACYSWO_31035 [Planctomycetota bacterium]|jgi:hypothetical protein
MSLPTPYYDRDGLNVRLCRRGEAWCGTAINAMLTPCGEPAAVAYRVSESSKWSYICAEHYGFEETDELRRLAQGVLPFGDDE